jgi:hypothetical protein
MNLFRKATARTISEVERRLEKAHPCARLEKDSVKLTPIFGTPFDATVFVFREKDPAFIGAYRRILVGELARRDVPHVYQAYQLTENKIKNASLFVGLIFSLSKRIRKDRRFDRGSNIINLPS